MRERNFRSILPRAAPPPPEEDPQIDQPPPSDIAGFDARLAGLIPTLPRRMRDCAEHLARSGDRIAVSTVAQLAEGAGVAPSVMMRFCRLMGFSGFSEMQRLFRDAYAPAPPPDYAERLAGLRRAGEDSPAALLGEFVEAGRRSLEQLAAGIDPEALDRAVDTLARARTIHLIGLRRAYPVAAYLAYAFGKMGVPALLHDLAGHLDPGHAIRTGDAVLAISFSPYTPATVEFVAEADRRGLPVVAITDSAAGPLGGREHVLLTVTEADFGAFRSLGATLALAMALSVAVGSRREGSTENPAPMEF